MAEVKKQQTGDDRQFILSHIGDYLSESMDSAPKSRYETLLNQEEYKTLIQKFQRAIGRLQLGLQGLFLDEDVVSRIRSFVLDPNVAESEIAEDADKVTLLERLLNLKNRLIIILIFFFCCWGVLSVLSREEVEKLDVLSALNFESLTMEDYAEGRLDLPTHDIDEARAYFNGYKGIGFTPALFKDVPNSWILDGASVIRYDDIAKVAVAQFSNAKKSKIFLYSLHGTLSDLPKADQRVVAGKTFTYQAYTSDDFNFIVWASGENRLALLVGRLSGEDLAKIASDNL